MTVLYVAGWMYSGSTLLGRVLGELDGAFAGGELTRMWSGFVRERPCGCGRPRSSCPVWTAVIEDAYEGEGVDAAHVDGLARSFRLNRRSAATVLALRGRGPRTAELRELRAHLARLYRSIASVTGARVVVDTSKSPVYAAILAGTPGVDLRVVQLVRDPRGSLLSGGERGHRTVGPAASMALWTLSHLALELGRRRDPQRYRLVRYEDFACRPGAVVESLARFAGLDGATLPFDGGHVALGESHVISGNEHARLDRGAIAIEPDEAWRSELGRLRHLGATSLTFPLLRRYGYRARG